MKASESLRLGQICGSVESCSLGISYSSESTPAMTLEDKIKALVAPLDEWNRALKLLYDEHILKLE